MEKEETNQELEKLNQKIKKYIEQHVDPLMRPLLLEIIKNQPANVNEFISQWTQKEGLKIQASIDSGETPTPEEGKSEPEAPEEEPEE